MHFFFMKGLQCYLQILCDVVERVYVVCEFRRRNQVTNPPSSHSVTLGETVDHKCPVFHPEELREKIAQKYSSMTGKGVVPKKRDSYDC